MVVTVPLGVLKAPDGPRFSPPLTARKRGAIKRIGFGCMNKVGLQRRLSCWKDCGVVYIMLAWCFTPTQLHHSASQQAMPSPPPRFTSTSTAALPPSCCRRSHGCRSSSCSRTPSGATTKTCLGGWRMCLRCARGWRGIVEAAAGEQQLGSSSWEAGCTWVCLYILPRYM